MVGHARTSSAREKATSRSSRSAAAPVSTASRASSSPSRRSSACPAAAIAPAALSRIASRRAPGAPASTSRIASAFSAGEPPRSSSGSQRSIPSSSGSIVRLAHPSVHDLAHVVRAARRQLVDAAGAVDDERAARTELHEHLRDRAHELRRVDADDLRAGAGRVRQRPEHVEDGPRRQLLPHRGRVTHGRMVRRREQEAEAELVDRARDPLRRLFELRSRAPPGRRPTPRPRTPRGCRAWPRRAPAAAATSAAAVEMFRVLAPSPPVPAVSTRSSRWGFTASTCARMASAQPAISSAVSPLARSATRKPAICAGVTSPRMIAVIVSQASSRLRSWPSRTRLRLAWIIGPGNFAADPGQREA